MKSQRRCSRRVFLERAGVASAALLSSGVSTLARASAPLQLEFLTIHDPDGWHPSLRLKGDWLVFQVSDGRLSGYGEASHSKDDAACREAAKRLFARHFASFDLSLEGLARIEAEFLNRSPDFVTATAFSGINQALYELLAKREGVPVWRLFTDKPAFEKIPLYTTINRALTTRSVDEYLDLVGKVREQGFSIFKCAPFEKVTGPERAVENAESGLETLRALRKAYPDIGIRIDFHERFAPSDFEALLPALEAIQPDWLEEPFPMGDAYHALRRKTKLTLAGGELFWGTRDFRRLVNKGWVDVIMPDVKHVGGFGPFLEVCRTVQARVEVSPHNPAGPISTAASLHAAVVSKAPVRTLEYAYDRAQGRARFGERVERGFIHLSDQPGWGLDLGAATSTVSQSSIEPGY